MIPRLSIAGAALASATLLLCASALGCGAPHWKTDPGALETPVLEDAGAPLDAAPATKAAVPPPLTAADAGTWHEPPPSTIAARHVLVQWMGCERAPTSVVRTRDQAKVVIDHVLSRARAGEDIARLALEFSDEPNAGSRGGSLGRFGKGQMVGAFEDTAFKLRPGELSGIVETSFGFHVIQRTE